MLEGRGKERMSRDRDGREEKRHVWEE